MENQLITLPTEVLQIAEKVSVEKRNEVQSVLNSVFNGVAKMREQLENVVVSGPIDKTNMKLANTIRLGVRQVRLDAEKIFDAKRSEVQTQMLGFKTEDQLWLKAKQTMQILTKEIEENARWKEETKERFDAEQKELKVQQRIIRVAKVSQELTRNEYENMSDEMFEIFCSGLEKAYTEKIESEKKAEEDQLEKEKAEKEERERIRIENERLKKEAEEKEKQLAEERKKADEERKKAEEKAKKEREESDRKLNAEREAARIASEKAAAERAKLEAEIKAKEKAELEQKRKIESDEKAERERKEKEERKLASAPDKEKLSNLCKLISEIFIPDVKTENAKEIVKSAKELLNKVVAYINTKSESL